MSYKNNTPYFGLDFGTSNSVISLTDQNGTRVVPINFDHKNQDIFKSAIYFKDKKYYFSNSATDQYLEDLKHAKVAQQEGIYTGEKINIFDGVEQVEIDLYLEYQTFGIGRLIRSFKSLLGNSFITKTKIDEKVWELTDLVALFLKEIKDRTEKVLGYEMDRVVVGRPVQFVNDNSNGEIPLQNLTIALQKAGFKNFKFEYEPVGAAYSHNFNQSGNIFVFDFGGGTLDTTILDQKTGNILTSHGAPLGGDILDHFLFDTYLAKYFGENLTYGNKNLPYEKSAVSAAINWTDITRFRTQKFFDYLDDIGYRSTSPETVKFIKYFLQNSLSFQLRNKIVDAKEKLSEVEMLDFVFTTKIKNFTENFKRLEYEKQIKSLLKKSQQVIEETLLGAKLKNSDINLVVATGGSSLMPAFQSQLKVIFEPEKLQIHEPFTAVSKGLSVLASKYFK